MIILISCLWLISAISKTISDTLAFRFKKSIFKNLNEDWWNPSKSWRNMYKNGKRAEGPKYLGSTTILRFTTDAWNLFEFLCSSCLSISIVTALTLEFKLQLLTSIILFLFIQVLYTLSYIQVSKQFFK